MRWRWACVKEGDAAALRLRGGGRCGGAACVLSREMQQRCACMKEDACGGAACASVRSEMRYDLRRDKDTLVGCLLG
jgi:hypothetical protein